MTRRPREVVTSRLVLEAIEARHVPDLWHAIESSHAELAPWMPWAIEPSLEETTAFVDEAVRAWNADQRWVFSICYEGEPVGTIGIDHYSPMLPDAEIGYWIRSDLSGRGLMSEACSAVVAYAFNELRLHRLELHAAPGNVASVRVAEKTGFRREGLLREASRGAGGYHDVYVFGLLRSDPRPILHRQD